MWGRWWWGFSGAVVSTYACLPGLWGFESSWWQFTTFALAVAWNWELNIAQEEITAASIPCTFYCCQVGQQHRSLHTYVHHYIYRECAAAADNRPQYPLHTCTLHTCSLHTCTLHTSLTHLHLTYLPYTPAPYTPAPYTPAPYTPPLHTCTLHTCTLHTCTLHTCTLHTCTLHTSLTSGTPENTWLRPHPGLWSRSARSRGLRWSTDRCADRWL